MDSLAHLLSSLPTVAAHFLIAVATWAVAALVLIRLTPADEIKLIRAGNLAAAIWTGGTLIALALPIAAAMRYSHGTAEVAVWSLLAALVQVVTYVAAAILAGKTRERLEQGDLASATMVAATQIAVALITAAALSG
jgi:putative membrane protein